MSLPVIILIIVLVIAFGGGGYYAGGNYGPYYGGGIGLVGLLVIILVVYLLLGQGMMAGQESDLLFNNLPAPYRALPTSPNIEDRRGASPDYAARMKNFGGLGGGSVCEFSAAFAPVTEW